MEEIFLDKIPPPADDTEGVEWKPEGTGINVCIDAICCCCKIERHWVRQYTVAWAVAFRSNIASSIFWIHGPEKTQIMMYYIKAATSTCIPTARRLLEKMLIFFAENNWKNEKLACVSMTLSVWDKTKTWILNNFEKCDNKNFLY